jgi:hypothetical protein
MTSICCKQCCAVVKTDGIVSRCSNQTVSEASDHCSVHNKTAHKLYVTYKDICEKAYNLVIEGSCIKYLIKCHGLLSKAYDARMAHRLYAYAPECYDDGHDLQFKFIQEKIDSCTSLLLEAYKNVQQLKEEDHKKEKEEDEDVEEEQESLLDIPEYKNVVDFTKRQKDDEDFFQKCLKENTKARKTRRTVVKLCFKSLESILNEIKLDKSIYSEKDISFIQSLSFQLVIGLSKLDYFKEDYTPTKCECGKCGEYVSDVIHHGCPCMLGKSPIEYAESSGVTVEYFKSLCLSIMTNREKIKDMLKEVIFQYRIYDTDIIKKNLELTWSEKENRVLIVACDPLKYYKRSVVMSINRQKKHVNKEELLDDYCDYEDFV